MNLFQSSPNFHRILECISYTPDDTLLVYDLGASAGLTPFKSYFFDYVKCSIPVQDISKVNEVIGIGTTIHKFVNTKDNLSTFQKWLIIYHHPRLALSVLRSFIRIAEERAGFLEIELRFTLLIGTGSTYPLVFLSLILQLFEIQRKFDFSLGGKVNFA